MIIRADWVIYTLASTKQGGKHDHQFHCFEMTNISLLNGPRTVLVMKKDSKCQEVIFNFETLLFQEEIINQTDLHKHAQFPIFSTMSNF